MFDEFMGIPVHPLVVHAAVVLVPLLCLLAVAYGLLPRFRGSLAWALVGLAVATPFAVWFATISGEKLAAARYAQELPPAVQDHEGFGETTLYLTVPLAVVALVLWWLTRRRPEGAGALPNWLTMAVVAVSVVLAAVTAYYLFRTGHSGAESVWGS